MVQFKAGEDRDLSVPTRVIVSGNAVTISGNSVVAKTSGQTIYAELKTSGEVAHIHAGNLTTMDYRNHAIHCGKWYQAQTTGTTVNATSGLVLLMVTPSNANMKHVFPHLAADAAEICEFWEGVTVTSTGTPVFAYNRNRTSTNSATILFYDGVIEYTSGSGTLLWSDLVGTYNQKTRVGGEGVLATGWILHSGTKYLLKIHKTEGNMHIRVPFHEYA